MSFDLDITKELNSLIKEIRKPYCENYKKNVEEFKNCISGLLNDFQEFKNIIYEDRIKKILSYKYKNFNDQIIIELDNLITEMDNFLEKLNQLRLLTDTLIKIEENNLTQFTQQLNFAIATIIMGMLSAHEALCRTILTIIINNRQHFLLDENTILNSLSTISSKFNTSADITSNSFQRNLAFTTFNNANSVFTVLDGFLSGRLTNLNLHNNLNDIKDWFNYVVKIRNEVVHHGSGEENFGIFTLLTTEVSTLTSAYIFTNVTYLHLIEIFREEMEQEEIEA